MKKGDVAGITVPCPHLMSTPHLSLCPMGSSPELVPGAPLRAWDSILSTEGPSADAAWQWGVGGVNAMLLIPRAAQVVCSALSHRLRSGIEPQLPSAIPAQ